MAYTDDWENLMNGVFGPGGKLRFDTQKTPPEKPGLPDMNAALLEQQKKLDEMLKKQNAELRRDTTQEALAQSRKMLEDMEADGLLAKGTTEVKQEHLGSFEGLAAAQHIVQQLSRRADKGLAFQVLLFPGSTLSRVYIIYGVFLRGM